MSVYLHLYLQNKVQTLQPGTQVLLVLTHRNFPSLISCSLLTMLAHVKFLQPPLPVKTTPICHARHEAVLKLPCRNFSFLQHSHLTVLCLSLFDYYITVIWYIIPMLCVQGQMYISKEWNQVTVTQSHMPPYCTEKQYSCETHQFQTFTSDSLFSLHESEGIISCSFLKFLFLIVKTSFFNTSLCNFNTRKI